MTETRTEDVLAREDLAGLVGEVFDGRYRIDALLGVGGMGAVYRAHHLGLGQDMALKVLRPEASHSKSVTARFQREARSASRLDHPNCVRVTDFGELEDGTKFLVMQLLDGTELEDRMGRPWPPAEAVEVALQILDGLAHAHAQGVVHRDLKPANVFVTTDHRGDEQVKLVDFGIAKIVSGEGADDNITRTGVVFGTPRYMSPEQASGSKVDERTDLYAVGLLLYEMLTGGPPFSADETPVLLRKHILDPPPPISGVPAPIVDVVMRLLEKSRRDRYPDAEAAMAALRTAREQVADAPPTAVVVPPMPPPAAGAAAAATAPVAVPPKAPLTAPTAVAITTPAGPVGVPPTAPVTGTPAAPTAGTAPTSASSWQPAPESLVTTGETLRVEVARLPGLPDSVGANTAQTVALTPRAPDSRRPVPLAPLILAGVMGFLILIGAFFFASGYLGDGDSQAEDGGEVSPAGLPQVSQETEGGPSSGADAADVPLPGVGPPEGSETRGNEENEDDEKGKEEKGKQEKDEEEEKKDKKKRGKKKDEEKKDKKKKDKKKKGKKKDDD